MPKRNRTPELDHASEDLIASIQDSDALESGLRKFEAERATFLRLFEDAKTDILAEFKAEDPETLSERDQIRFNTKLKYEEGLRDDRLRVIDENMRAYKDDHSKQCNTRKRRRVLDRKIAECQKLAKEDPVHSDWKFIGKLKHAQVILNDKVQDMSTHQKETYAHVLKELKEKGWRVLAPGGI